MIFVLHAQCRLVPIKDIRLLVDPPWLDYIVRAGGFVGTWLPLQDEYGIRGSLYRSTQPGKLTSDLHHIPV